MLKCGVEAKLFGTVAITQRSHAEHNPRALMRKPMSLDDYLASRLSSSRSACSIAVWRPMARWRSWCAARSAARGTQATSDLIDGAV